MLDKSGENMPFEKIKWDLVERTGWTLEYIDALEIENLHEYLQVQDGLAKFRGSLLRKG